MVTKIVEWVSIMVLLIVASWCPFASYQIPLDLVVLLGLRLGGSEQPILRLLNLN